MATKWSLLTYDVLLGSGHEAGDHLLPGDAELHPRSRRLGEELPGPEGATKSAAQGGEGRAGGVGIQHVQGLKVADAKRERELKQKRSGQIENEQKGS